MNDPPYDPDARRDTPLALKLKERIRREGPITVAQYMRACLQDPEHGYYRTRTAIGRAGDFITAPEISQVFGELIGLWAAIVWQQMGSPSRVNLVELGPGRGTLIKDALRAARIVPGFHGALSVHLVESNEPLRVMQRAALADFSGSVTWHDDIFASLGHGRAIAAGATIIIANEFLDADPISQWVFQGGQWHERGVDLDEAGKLRFTTFAASDDFTPTMGPDYVPQAGDINERCAILAEMGVMISSSLQHPFAALFIDYGHTRSAPGDTLQAVEAHKSVSPLFAPGESDLTAHVDFEMFENLCTEGNPGAAVDGPVTQAEFLGSLGIMERASRLMSANPAKAHEIELGIARLMAVPGMGSRFKVMGVRSKDLPPLPGF